MREWPDIPGQEYYGHIESLISVGPKHCVPLCKNAHPTIKIPGMQRSFFWRGGLGWQLDYVCVAVGGRGEHTQPKWDTLAKPASRVCGEIGRDRECSPTSLLYVES